MASPISGIHHITAISGDAQRNLDFYTGVLGQRLIKTTVNFDDTGAYHFYFGDEIGHPGTLLTFFPWPHARRGRRGAGEVGAVAYAVSPRSLDFWRQRLVQHGVAVAEPTTRFGETVLPFPDPDGMMVELVASEHLAEVSHWTAGPIPAEHAIHGFHSATLWVGNPARSVDLLTQTLGFTLVGAENGRTRLRSAAAGAPGAFIDLLAQPGLAPGAMGAGTVHHIAFRAPDDAEQLEWQATLGTSGYRVTEVMDRQYFHSIYFREPGGVLYEIATDPPGFTWDEPVEMLGTGLKLPPWLEPQRQAIERALPPIRR